MTSNILLIKNFKNVEIWGVGEMYVENSSIDLTLRFQSKLLKETILRNQKDLSTSNVQLFHAQCLDFSNKTACKTIFLKIIIEAHNRFYTHTQKKNS